MPARLPESPDFRDIHKLTAQFNSLSYRERRQLLWQMKEPWRPRFLYKYRTLEPSNIESIDRLRDLLVRSRFWLSSPTDFNDPFDMSAQMIAKGSIQEKRQRIDTILKRRGDTWTERQKALARMALKPNEEFAKLAQQQHESYAIGAGVYSFGGDPRSILIWSHYATNHEGLCFQFETAREPNCFSATLKVRYSENYPIVNWLLENEFYEGIGSTLEQKHAGWSYEKEIRIFIPDAAHQYLPFRPESLSAVIIGCRTRPDTEEQLRNLLTERTTLGLPQLILYRAYKHPSKYKLVIRRERVA